VGTEIVFIKSVKYIYSGLVAVFRAFRSTKSKSYSMKALFIPPLLRCVHGGQISILELTEFFVSTGCGRVECDGIVPVLHVMTSTEHRTKHDMPLTIA